MVTYTPAPYSIPYLQPTDPADIPYAGQILAERVAALLAGTDLPYGKMWKTTDNQAYVASSAAVVAMQASRLSGGVTFAANLLTVPVAGYYRIAWGLMTSAPSSNSWVAARLEINGVKADMQQGPSTSLGQSHVKGFTECNLAAGSTLALTAQSGVNVNLRYNGNENETCWLSVTYLRPTFS